MTRYTLKRDSNFGRLVVFLNQMPLGKTMFQAEMIDRMDEGQKSTYKHYIGMLHKKSYVDKTGRGKDAVVKRLKAIPQIKMRTDIVNDY